MSELELIQKVIVLETEFKNHAILDLKNQEEIIRSLAELKMGIGMRVEQAGKDIAVLYEKTKDASEKISALEKAKAWFVMSIIGAFIASIWSMVIGGKRP